MYFTLFYVCLLLYFFAVAYVTYADYLKSWEKAFTSKKHKMIVIYYEDMKKDIANEARKLSDFLGIPINEKLIAEIAEQCQFNEMKSRFDAKMLGVGSYKPDKTYGFMRKGKHAAMTGQDVI